MLIFEMKSPQHTVVMRPYTSLKCSMQNTEKLLPALPYYLLPTESVMQENSMCFYNATKRFG